ncbi:unnamed protein product [Ambrosiozyma monospora]|uniref:Unnamed protein product n=1 Tax=Ambrosiozyma monospora TaxID=43982 RepID=A0A9W7DIB0_AMBMO|nr:unnamed protein product [Ambrosiozyma monospora]
MRGDLSQENQPEVTHLHLDTVLNNGGYTRWVSSYAAYDKWSEEFKNFLDGKNAVFSLAHNREHTESSGVSPVESDITLNYLFDVSWENADIQVRFKWDPTQLGYGVSALWNKKISQHRSVWDHEGNDVRHGTRVSSLSDKSYFDPKSSQREALGLSLEE